MPLPQSVTAGTIFDQTGTPLTVWFNWQGYRGIDRLGYTHERRSQRAAQIRREEPGELLPTVFVLDASGGGTRMEAARDAATTFVDGAKALSSG